MKILVMISLKDRHRPHLQVILDMTMLVKRDKFKTFSELISVFHDKRRVHLAVLYLIVDPWQVQWSFRVYAQLGLALVPHLTM